MVMTSDMYHLMFERIKPEECMFLKSDLKIKKNKKNGVKAQK